MIAHDLLAEIEIFSERFLAAQYAKLPHVSPWTGGVFLQRPLGAVLHYTADECLDRVLRWFLDPAHASHVSAHLVVADRVYGSAREHMAGLSAVAKLPVTVVQCVPWDIIAHHAARANSTTFGIELLNGGYLDYNAAGEICRSVAGGELVPWSVPYAVPVPLWGRLWAPFPSEQVWTAVQILRALHVDYGPFAPSWVLGHELVDADKQDPGPAFPLEDVRNAIFLDHGHDPRIEAWWPWFEGDPLYGESVRDGWVIAWARGLDGVPPGEPTPGVAWERLRSALDVWGFGEGPFLPLGRLAFRLLGYCTAPTGALWSDSEARTVRWFQRMMRLPVNGIPDVKVRRALVERLITCGYL